MASMTSAIFYLAIFCFCLAGAQQCTEGSNRVVLGGQNAGDQYAYLTWADFDGNSILPGFRLVMLDGQASPQYLQFSLLSLRTRDGNIGPPWSIIDAVDTADLNWQANCSVNNEVTISASLNESVVDVERRQATVEVYFEFISEGRDIPLNFDLPTPDVVTYTIGSRNYKFGLRLQNWWDPGYPGNRTQEKFQAILEFYSSAILENFIPVDLSEYPLWKTQILVEEEDKREVEMSFMSLVSLRDVQGGDITKDPLLPLGNNPDWSYIFRNETSGPQLGELHRITHYLSFDSFGYSLDYDPNFSVLLPDGETEDGDGGGGDGDGDDANLAHIAWAALVIPACCVMILLFSTVLCVLLVVSVVGTWLTRMKMRKVYADNMPVDF